MKKFRFKLDPLLKIRKMEEDRALQELAKVMRDVNREEQQIQTSRRLYDEEMEEFTRRHDEKFELGLSKMHDLYLERLLTEAREAEQRKEKLRPALEKEQEKVREARKRRRVVELLREKRKAEYEQNTWKREQKEFEETNRMIQESRRALEELHEDHRRTELVQQRDEEDSESAAREEEFSGGDRAQGDAISEYFKKIGKPDPRFDKR